MFRRFIPAVLLASLAACGGVTDPSKNQNETLSGTIQPGSSNAQPFSASKSGEISITVTSMNPTLPSGTFFAVGWGVPVSGQCSPNFGFNTLVVVGANAISNAITPGSYCVVVSDYYGSFKTAEQYTMTVSHP